MSLRRTLRRKFRLVSVAPIMAMYLSSCIPLLFDDRCGPEHRSTELSGEIRNATGALLGTAHFKLTEVRGDTPPRTMHFFMMGPGFGSGGAPLKGHVIRAVLQTATGSVVTEFFLTVALADAVAYDLRPMDDPVEFEELRSQALTQNLVVVIETDLAGSEQLRVPMPIAFSGDWDRSHCS